MTMPSGDPKRAFGEIYRSHSWGSASKSGPGSEPAHTVEYRQLVERLLRELRVERVVDLGCGDWAFSRLIDWSSVDYTGVEVVPELVDELSQRFGGPKRRFVCSDFSKKAWPDADLVLIKDVLQHWPNAAVMSFLARVSEAPFALVTNDYRKLYRGGPLRLYRWKELRTANTDIQFGESRTLQLTEPPFQFDAIRVALFEHEVGRTRFIKESLLWTRPTGAQP